ncbi:hypothetical protein BH09BAC4_BH09BAC4_41250 [soil metagenome]
MGTFQAQWVYFILFWGISYRVQAQSSAQLIADLQAIHKTIKSSSCMNQQVISNRAMNLFLADKIGYSLTDYKSLSFYKNYITFNTGDGIFSLNHNFFQPTGTDEPVRSFYVVGVKANVANALVSTLTEKPFTNDLGITLKKSWIGKPKTIVNNCFEKQVMDNKRESILVLLAQEIKKREDEFINSLSAIKQDELPDSTSAKVKAELRRIFYAKLTDEFSLKFAESQYQELSEITRYKRITTHWTNLSVYLPVIAQRFTVVNSLIRFSEIRKAYPFDVSINHTRFWEIKKAGRFFLSMEASVYLNNAIQSQSLESSTYSQYKNAGGIDTLALRISKINAIFIGNYQTFLTPSTKLTVVYYPPDSHIGLSTTLTQNIGAYRALNWSVGIPIVLINKMGAPSANFEFRLNYADLTHVVFPNRAFSDNMSISLTVGVPFSKIIY